jgi:thiol-disulfide isomerase/thioredoxin
MSGKARVLARLAVALAAGALLAGCAVGKNAVDQGSQYSFVSPGGKVTFFYDPATRKPLADLSGQSLQQPNQQLRISQYQNDVVVVNIWGAWCADCRSEAPELQQVFNQTKSLGVQLLGIDFKDPTPSDALDFMKDYQMDYPSIYDFAGRTLLQLNNFPRSSVPATIVLDRQHRVAAVYLERVTAAQLLPELQKIASEKV